MTLRWGIAGAGNISHDFHTSLVLESSEFTGNHKVCAIASRSIERSKKFALEHNIEHYYGSYAELAKDNNIEIVYIATLNPTHHELCLLMLNHGKHVLCEKPLAMNYRQAKEITSLAKEKNLFFMEAIWSRFFPAYKYLNQLISSADFTPKEIHLTHGFEGEKIDRIAKKEFGGSIVLDIGVYAIQFCLFVFGAVQPLSVRATGKLNENGVDIEFEAVLTFPNNRKATIFCSGLNQLENKAVVVTNNGSIHVPSFWCPTSLIEANGTEKIFDLPTSSIPVNFTNSYGLRYEADQVQKCIRSGQLCCEVVPPNDSLLIAQIQDEIRKQIGAVYETDL